MKKLILRNHQSPGDILMLTAALRDLHRCAPEPIQTDVRTSCPALWENNPHVTPLNEEDAGVEVLDCHYPLIHQSNERPYHFLHGFSSYLNEKLGLGIRPTVFGGDIHLSPAEKAAPSPVSEIVGTDLPYWIIVAGGKYDYTIKWWNFRRYQAVVNAWRGRVLFVQVGEKGHYHPALDGVIDLRGRTTLRELIRLVHHAQGVVCPVTFLMHLAAAVEVRPGAAALRPCVVVAGGREAPHWEAYPGHQFIHTVGALDCCATGGCWRSRTVPLGDGDEKDQPRALCRNVVNELPRCMDMITPEDVVRGMERYFSGGQCRFLQPAEYRQAHPHLRRGLRQELGLSVATGGAR